MRSPLTNCTVLHPTPFPSANITIESKTFEKEQPIVYQKGKHSIELRRPIQT